jgi:hypothetical protein
MTVTVYAREGWAGSIRERGFREGYPCSGAVQKWRTSSRDFSEARFWITSGLPINQRQSVHPPMSPAQKTISLMPQGIYMGRLRVAARKTAVACLKFVQSGFAVGNLDGAKQTPVQ